MGGFSECKHFDDDAENSIIWSVYFIGYFGKWWNQSVAVRKLNRRTKRGEQHGWLIFDF